MSRDDRVIRQRILDALDASRELDDSDIRVDVSGGVAVLRGRVHSFAEKLEARTIAARTDGVLVVDVDLQVRRPDEGGEIPDALVASAVRAALTATGVPVGSIGVTVEQHVAALTGRVATVAIRQVLHHAVAEVAGVHFVEDDLEVDPVGAEVPRGGEALSVEASWRHLRRRDVGRLAVRRDEGVDIFPVNYKVGPRAIYFRSGPGAKLELLTAHPEVAFEVDGGRGASRWSVVLRGVARRLDADLEIAASGAADIATWDASEKLNYIRLDVDTITGRRFTHPG